MPFDVTRPQCVHPLSLRTYNFDILPVICKRFLGPWQGLMVSNQPQIISQLLKICCLILLCFPTGCGSGKYLSVNQDIIMFGSDRCHGLVDLARGQGHEVMVCDNMQLPYRDCCFDAVISIGVLHHLTTRRRRTRALWELARILRPGGRLMLYVWAMEQNKRKVRRDESHPRGLAMITCTHVLWSSLVITLYTDPAWLSLTNERNFLISNSKLTSDIELIWWR